MSPQDSEKTPITFCDVAAYFSEEEWKLLHEWQKELYKNVMKEIHQAITSLAPLIASSVFSLRPKHEDDLCSMDHEDTERRCGIGQSSSDPAANSVISFTINLEETQNMPDPQDTSGGDIKDCARTGFASFNSDSTSVVEQDMSVTLVEEDTCPKGGESSTDGSTGDVNFTPMTSFAIKEEGDVYFVEHISTKKRKNIIPPGFTSSSTESQAIVNEARQEFRTIHDSVRKEGIPSSFSFSIKDESETGSMDHQHFERKANTDNISDSDKGREMRKNLLTDTDDLIGTFRLSQPDIHRDETHFPKNLEDEQRHTTGDGHLNQPIRDALGTTCTEKAPPCKDSSRKLSTNLFKSPEKGTIFINQPLPQSKWELQSIQRTHWDNSFSNPALVNLQHGVPKGASTYTYNECENNPRSAAFSTSLQQTMQNPRPFMCAEFEKSYSQEREFETQAKTHTGVRPREKPYACSDCEKSFSLKGALHRHQRTHTGEKPYTCIECLKSFSQKTDLHRHQRTHTGEKPYTCTVCHKSFNRKYNFNTHRRLHTVQKGNNSAGPSKADYVQAVALAHRKPN